MIRKLELQDPQPAPHYSEESAGHRKRTHSVYSRLAGLYSFFRIADGLETVLELMDIRSGQRVLDVGTGPGVYALRIARNWPNCTVHGLDPCERFLEIARKRAGRLSNTNIHFAAGDAEKLDYEGETFDRVLFAGTLVLVPDKVRAISETHRVLKRGGVAVFKELLHKRFLHKELFYLFWNLYIKTLGIFQKDMRGIKRSDYEGQKFTEPTFVSLLEESPFSDYRVFSKGTRLYAVCRK